MINNLVEVQYAQTDKSSNTDALGMREMQAMVYAARNRQHILVKAPPASGKSRAMMFVALDKLENQGIRKVIVAGLHSAPIAVLMPFYVMPAVVT